MDQDTANIRALCASSQRCTPSAFSSGLRITNASTAKPCSPTNNQQAVFSRLLAGQVGHEGGRARLLELHLGLGQRLPDAARRPRRWLPGRPPSQRAGPGRRPARRTRPSRPGRPPAARRRYAARRTARRWPGPRSPSRARRCGARSSRPSASAQSSVRWPSTSRPVRRRHRGGQTADRGGHHRRAAGLRLQRDQPERLAVAGHHGQVGGRVVVGQPAAGRPAGTNRTRSAMPSSAARLA